MYVARTFFYKNIDSQHIELANMTINSLHYYSRLTLTVSSILIARVSRSIYDLSRENVQ